MTFIEKNKTTLIVGVSALAIGFVSGQFYETYVYQKQLEHKILSQVFSQQDQMREDREEASRKLKSQMGSVENSWKSMKERHKRIDEERPLKKEETQEKPFGSDHKEAMSQLGTKD